MDNSGNIPYTFERAIADFGRKILVNGAETALTDHTKYTVSDSEKDDTTTLSAKFSADNYYKPFKAVIQVDRQRDELVETSCGCQSFSDDRFSCTHIGAVLISYYIDKYGLDVLRKYGIEEGLIKKTGIATPLVPGILRKTDSSITQFSRVALISQKQLPEPLWTQSKASGDKHLSVECVLHSTNGRVRIEVKAGAERRYVIKDLLELLACYKHGGTFQFGTKTAYRADRENYDAQSRNIMDILSMQYELYERQEREGILFSEGYSYQKRYMWLEGQCLDDVLEALNGTVAAFSTDQSEQQKFRIELEAAPALIKVSKVQFGATVNIPSQNIIGSGARGLYITENDRILRVPADQWDIRQKLSHMKQANELFVRDTDMPGFIQALMEYTDDISSILESEDHVISVYIPERPVFRIMLDLPQSDLIACKAEAEYPAGDKYSIFDAETDLNHRNIILERQMGERIWSYFNAFSSEENTLYLNVDEAGLFDFLVNTIPALSQICEVFVSEKLKRLKVRSAGSVAVGVSIDSGNLLVDLKSNFMDEHEMIEFLSRYESKKNYTRLKNGEFIRIEPEDSEIWDALAETFRSYGRKNPSAMRVPLFRALYLQEALDERDDVLFEAHDDFRNLIRSLNDASTGKRKVPDELKTVLRGYQKDGFHWICMLKDNGLGGILADEMGLGKTLQVIAVLLSEMHNGKTKDQLRTIIITPASLVYNWKREIQEFAPELNCRVIAGTASNRHAMLEQIDDADIYITSYDLLKNDLAYYEQIKFANEIIDEAQFIKNHNTQSAKAVRIINSSFRLALTGTPIENRLSELWSIFDYLMPGFLYNYSRFRDELENPIISNNSSAVMERLRKMVHPFILRRLKKDVLTDLPDKIEEPVIIRMEGEQRKLYDAYAERLRLYLDKQSDEEFKKNKLEVLTELTRLRQICCGPGVFLENYKGSNAKMDACMELVRQAIDGGHKLLIFSQFTSVLDEICASLEQTSILYHRIDGSVSKEERMRMVNSFEHDSVSVFCISLKAGGTGINLTAADIVIHFDPWWNVAAQNQATDRTHRIGQQNTVNVYKLIAEDTIEEKIIRLQQSKAQLAEDVLSGEGISSIIINKEDLLGLL